MTTLLGTVVYERAYYFCRHCHHGEFPTDPEFRLVDHKTPAARELIALAGTLEPFAEAAQRVLVKMAGLNLSAQTVRRTTEAAGEDVAHKRAARTPIGPDIPWNWRRDKQGRTLACVELDATGVCQQGPHPGEKAEGRMPWVAGVFNPPGLKNQPQQARYVSGLMNLEEIGQQLRRECQSVGLDQADVVVGLSDGGAGLEGCLIDAVAGMAGEFHLVLDFFHAAEHVREFAKLWIPEEAARGAFVQRCCDQLKEQGGAGLLENLKSLDLSQRSDEVRESHRRLVGYVGSNRHRMNYPAYLARGWPIGSGAIESACKTVVGQRLKGSGMRWRERGTTALCQLRALYRSGPDVWSEYWKHHACT